MATGSIVNLATPLWEWIEIFPYMYNLIIFISKTEGGCQ